MWPYGCNMVWNNCWSVLFLKSHDRDYEMFAMPGKSGFKIPRPVSRS